MSYTDIEKALSDPNVIKAIEKSINQSSETPSSGFSGFSVEKMSKEKIHSEYGETSILLALIQRMNGIQRWNKSQPIKPEYLHEHSVSVALFCLIIGKHYEISHPESAFSAEKLAIYGIFHDAGEALSEDFNGLFKHNDPIIKAQVKNIESQMLEKLATTVDPILRDDMRDYIVQDNLDEVYSQLLKACDELSALSKAMQELRSNNYDFIQAFYSLDEKVRSFFGKYPEVEYVYNMYMPSFKLTIDELSLLLPNVNINDILS
ncbi:YfbR-like 5'-deoxynucleotidase [Photobacterium kishitanii]|uniref:HD/PDEase domain-containing protein n=1 Tax=Photobacterium kishitanii TaxID=318456 RepID=A0A2T3KMN1_9GAMM|nr:YfbR-like 5'-deoxynucleotidase [Photobacterium kishitanii]PSV01048.1 hypothetical protein C9J27_03250 [Photobacterium kishitanii]